MAEVTLEPMTSSEFAAWRGHSIQAYAEEHVAAGTYAAAEAVERSTAEYDHLLPAGQQTPNMVFFLARDRDGGEVGVLWISLVHPRGAPDTAFIFDIQVRPEHRSKGFGRALLAAGEEEVRRRGVGALALNVFGDNPIAIELYSSSGYRVTTQQMRKQL